MNIRYWLRLQNLLLPRFRIRGLMSSEEVHNPILSLGRRLRRQYIRSRLSKGVISADYLNQISMERYYQQRKLVYLRLVLSKIVTREDSVVVDLGAGDGTILDIAHAYSPKAHLMPIELSVEHCQSLQGKGYNPIPADASYIPLRRRPLSTLQHLPHLQIRMLFGSSCGCGPESRPSSLQGQVR